MSVNCLWHPVIYWCMLGRGKFGLLIGFSVIALSDPPPKKITDMISGGTIKANNSFIELDIPPGGTRLFRIDKELAKPRVDF